MGDLFFWIVLFVIISSVKDIKKRVQEKLEEANRELSGDDSAPSSSGTPVADSMADLRDEIRRRIEQKRADEAMERNQVPEPVFEQESEVFHSEPHPRTASAPARPHLPEGQADPFHGPRHSPSIDRGQVPVEARIEDMSDMPAVVDVAPMPLKPVAASVGLKQRKASPVVVGRRRKRGYGALKRRLRSGKGLKEAFVLNEVVSKPKSLSRSND